MLLLFLLLLLLGSTESIPDTLSELAAADRLEDLTELLGELQRAEINRVEMSVDQCGASKDPMIVQGRELETLNSQLLHEPINLLLEQNDLTLSKDASLAITLITGRHTLD